MPNDHIIGSVQFTDLVNAAGRTLPHPFECQLSGIFGQKPPDHGRPIKPNYNVNKRPVSGSGKDALKVHLRVTLAANPYA